MKKSIVAASIALALGVSSSASAGLLANSTTFNVTVNGAGSCFAFGDCTTLVDNIPGGSFTITTAATGDGFTVGDYSMSDYTGTPGGLFSTGGLVAGVGTVGAGGELDLNFAGRTGSAQFFPFLGTPAWNIDDNTKTGGTTGEYEGFTSGSDSNLDPVTGLVSLTLAGSNLVDNGDGTYSALLVSVGNVGAGWGSFDGTPYSEVYSVTVEASVIPVPAAAWLFGSGLLGLVGIARRRKSA